MKVLLTKVSSPEDGKSKPLTDKITHLFPRVVCVCVCALGSSGRLTLGLPVSLEFMDSTSVGGIEPLGFSPLQLQHGSLQICPLHEAFHLAAGDPHSGSQACTTSMFLTLSSYKSPNSVGYRYSSFTSCQIMKGKEEVEWPPASSRDRRKSVL